VGSKAELVMVMSQLAGRRPGTHLVCNGFKDAEYMELVGGAATASGPACRTTAATAARG
jgi:arginine decarboxylase-like protein